jgi:hypothetical protein
MSLRHSPARRRTLTYRPWSLPIIVVQATMRARPGPVTIVSPVTSKKESSMHALATGVRDIWRAAGWPATFV